MIDIAGVKNLKEIHESNHSIICKGERVSDNKPVAVKILKDEFPSLKMIAKFNGEFEITNKLEVDGVRKAFEKVKANNQHVIILDYVEGEPLQKVITNKKTDIKDFIEKAIQITKILSQVHVNNIIHKDINPRNIIIGNDKQDISIIDFGIASSVKKSTQKMESPDGLEGSLHYISPEQTGRMNRSIDYRTDLYSLGVTFYEFLTGNLPFEGNDAMELVHAHMAKTPKTPHEINNKIPKPVSDIVMKLMAKNAEDRYQSSYGVQVDLENCLDQWETTSSINAFELATQDIFDIFQVPEKLYGREKETSQLLESFDRVSKGSKELMLVAGYSGIGKTALVNEVYKPITEKRGYFIGGKFDQFTRDVPYSAIIYALKDFVSQLLTEPTEKIERWKKIILDAVGSNGQLIIDVVPNLELIIGEQQPLPELGPTETQNRFNVVFQSFIREISREDHPLVIFIDDWQWADFASLNLLKLLMTDTENQYLLILGAYRDNEVDESHPFIQTLEEIKKEAEGVDTITLAPLKKSHVETLVSDTLKCTLEHAKPLASLIYDKTQGNPFFVNQFFQTLYEDKLIKFNNETRVWQWDTKQINKKEITNNVVELLAGKIKKLSPETQAVLKTAACIGNEFDLKTLSFLNNKNQKATLQDLWEAVDEGLIKAVNENYQAVEEDTIDAQAYFFFLHDRVQQATYSLLDEEARKETSLQIGRNAYENNTDEYLQEWILDITNYFNIGKELITDNEEKLLLAKLNLQAGNKAKKSTAYRSAIRYFSTALDLLGANAWEHNYQMTFDLYKEQGECEFLLGQFEKSDELLDIAYNNASSKIDKAHIYIIKISQMSGQGKYPEAVGIVIEALNMFNMGVPELEDLDAINLATQKEIGIYQENMKTRTVQELWDLPLMENKEVEICTEIIAMALDSIAIGVAAHLGFYATKMINISIEHGTSKFTPMGQIYFCMVLSGGFKDYENAYNFAELALKLNEDKFFNPSIKSKVFHIYAYYSLLRKHYNTCIEFHQKAYYVGLELGDFPYAGYGLAVVPRFTFPRNIEESFNAINKGITYFKQVNNAPMLLVSKMYTGFAKCLQGDSKNETSFEFDDFTESSFKDAFEVAAPLFYAIYKRYKLQVFCLFELYNDGLELVNERNTWISVLGPVDLGFRSDYYLNCGIIVSYFLLNNSDTDSKDYLEILDECISEIQLLSDQSKTNFLHQLQLLKAKKAEFENRVLEAMDFYDSSIQLAQENNYTKDEALACELAADFYLKLNKKDIARIYISRSHYAYNMWGANSKVKHLEKKYLGYLNLSQGTQTSSTLSNTVLERNTTIQATTQHTHQDSGLDFQSIMKASQALSQEIKFEILLEKMMRVIVENAGGQNGALILKDDKKYLVQAKYDINNDQVEVLLNTELENASFLPVSIINYVKRTKKFLVLNNASKQGNFTSSTYIKKHQPKSVLCAPILKLGELKAIIYLENNLSTNVFTEDRLLVLNMLSSQIAISIDNALLYENLEQKVAERTAEVVAQKKVIELRNQQITDSIKYAQKIQEAILPLEKELSKELNDHFILYQPKDIVSGDFYWFSKMEDKIFIAVVDCTGHGVPGAFMSMIGSSILDEIVNVRKIFDPAEILEELHKSIYLSLNQSATETQDGMDLGLVKIEQNIGNYKVTFAGAKEPFYFIKDGKFNEIKGSRVSIGGWTEKLKSEIQNHEIELNKNDCFYLITDGYIDQAGGNGRAKFGSKKFKELLNEMASIPLNEQKDTFKEALRKHQMNHSQRDDITVLGIKL